MIGSTIVRNLLRGAGIDARRANTMTCWDLRVPRLLEQHDVRTVLDVGANDGGYASALLLGGFRGRVISFEPLPLAWDRLRERAAKRANWHVAPRMALSDEEGEADFHEAGNSASSSLLGMTSVHLDAAPSSRTVSTTRVRTRTLDSVLRGLDCEAPIFLKLDVQGAEHLVLRGAREALDHAVVGIQLEMSLASLYEDQASACDLDKLLRSHGFQCWDILPGFRDPNSLRMLQCDGIYFKSDQK